jgi:hypothetical protein
VSAFIKPIKRLRKELSWLQLDFCQLISGSRDRHKRLACEMIVVRMHDSWARFCRELIILSAYGRTTTLSGTFITPCHSSINRCSMVIPHVRTLFSRQNWEPRWADSTACINAARRLQISNVSTVSAALSAIDSPAEKMRRVRNFYAHRKHGTAQEALATNLFSRPFDVLDLAAYTTGNVRIIESWASSLVLVAVAASQ